MVRVQVEGESLLGMMMVFLGVWRLRAGEFFFSLPPNLSLVAIKADRWGEVGAVVLFKKAKNNIMKNEKNRKKRDGPRPYGYGFLVT